MVKPRKCRKCGKVFRPILERYTLCPVCWRKEPKCRSCRIVMAPAYGSLEGFARKVGIFSICTGCNYEINRKGFLHISETQYLMPSGRVKIKSVPAEDMVG
jgi:hypothetical protein